MDTAVPGRRQKDPSTEAEVGESLDLWLRRRLTSAARGRRRQSDGLRHSPDQTVIRLDLRLCTVTTTAATIATAMPAASPNQSDKSGGPGD